jgi:hypothetical protein
MKALQTEDRTKSRRCLRVGILLRGHIVEERMVGLGHDVTLGTNAKCTFVVPSEGLPRRWSLFRWHGDRCELRQLPRMNGRLVANEAAFSLPEGVTTLLSPAVRGKVRVGELTVLFQMVSLPILARPCLPASMRGSVFGMLDRPFATVVALCFVLHLAFVLQLRRIDWLRSPEHLANDFKQVFIRHPIPMKPAVPSPSTAKTTAQGKSKSTTTAPKPKPRSTGERRQELVNTVNRIGLLALLTAKNAEMGNAVADLLSNGGVERSQEAALAGVNAVQLASADSRLAIRMGGGSGKIMDVHGLSNSGLHIAMADTGKGEERRVVRIDADQPLIDSSSAGHLDASQLTREVRGRLGALRACYERSLKRNPNLAGKLLLHLTITGAGTVSSVDLTSDSLDDSDLAGCVRSSVLRWRFPAPDGGSIEVSFPFVFQSAN